jgi:hypothetical protein
MPQAPFTGIDLTRGTNLWSELDRTLYNQLPIYFNKVAGNKIKHFNKWGKLLKSHKWTPAQGNTLRGIRKVGSPVTRSQVLPNKITELPLKDVIAVRELFEDAQLYRHDFESNLFQFQPAFADFLNDHVTPTADDISEKIGIFTDQFYRTAIFHGSPHVWVCGKDVELTAVDYWRGPNIALSKTQAVLQALIADCTQGFTLEHVKKLGTVLHNDIGATPFTGGTLPDGTDGEGIYGKYALLMGTEPWDAFTDSGANSYLLENKKLNLDIVTGPFTGSLFGRFTTMFERYEMRIASDGTIPAPELTEENPDAYNQGDPVPNPAYVNAPFAVAHAIGGEAYKSISVGPPPTLFARGGLSMEKFSGMDWNGKVHMTRNLLIPSLAADNATIVHDTNKRGEYLQLIADAVMGILPIRRRNIVPVIYLRTRTQTN